MYFRYFLQALIILWSGLAFAFEMKTGVKIATVLRADLYDSYQGVGEVKKASSRDFYAKIPGTITYITEKQGAYIKAGEVILEIGGSATHAMRKKTLSAFKSAEFSFKKDQALFDKRLISEEAFKKAELNYETAKHEREKTMHEYGEMVILAPFDGHLGVMSHSVGDNVSSEDYLLSITGGDATEITVNLPGKLIDSVKENTKVELIFNKDKEVEAHVISTSPHISRSSGNFIVKIAAEAKDLRHGSYVKVKFFLNPRLGLVVPESAIQKNEEGSFVFIMDDESKARQTFITTGTRLFGKAEVLGGLAEGQKVIVEGLTSLKNGSLVNVTE